jgi:hypothetical protein
MIIDGNTIDRHPVEAEVALGSHVSLILFAMYTSGLIMRVEEYVSEAKGIQFVENLRWVANG